MATVALIQRLFRVLTYSSSEELHGLQVQIYDNFYEALEEEYNHNLQIAKSLDDYLQGNFTPPDLIICVPLAEEGNPAPGLAEIQRFKDTFPDIPLVVWSTRTEESLRQTCLSDLGCAAYYTGTLLSAPDELPALIAEILQ
ncbi:hypothetical protein ACFLYO_04060 [Chloroflexota bacterium]